MLVSSCIVHIIKISYYMYLHLRPSMGESQIRKVPGFCNVKGLGWPAVPSILFMR